MFPNTQQIPNVLAKQYMVKLLFGLLLTAMFSDVAHADSFYKLVGYDCDSKHDQLILTYDGAYNEAGEAMMASKTSNQWNPWSLVVATDDGDHIKSLKTVSRRCRLSDGNYQIDITPSPGNFDIQGRCGAWLTAEARVKKQRKTIYLIKRFEEDCQDSNATITTRVKISPGKSPSIKVLRAKWADFYGETKQP